MLSVQDIMQTDVVTVAPETTARYLARLLADEEISGVPVVDADGMLAGVVSSTDLVRLAADDSGIELRPTTRSVESLTDSAREDEEEEELQDPYGFFLPEDSPFTGQRFLEQWPESDFDTILVRDIMTPVSFSVEPGASLPELCEFLVRGRIHRALVTEGGSLVGIVTSADVLRAIAERKVTI